MALETKETNETKPLSCKSQWSWQLKLWKSRLPVVVVPLLASLRNLAEERRLAGPLAADGFEPPARTVSGLPREASYCVEFALLCGLAASTGTLQLPFSVTWWLILLAAFVLETDLTVGVATVLSLSVLLGWYGVRLRHPHAVMALWGGSRGGSAAPKDGLMWLCWQAWDLVVHLLPGVLMLYWHGPSLSRGPCVPAGIAAVAASLPLNMLWLWSLGGSLPTQPGGTWAVRRRLWPWGLRLSETNAVYGVEPLLPDGAWGWIFGSHWLVCAVWAACLTLPRDVLLAYSVFMGHGLLWLPFTNAWWTVFLIAVFSSGVGPYFRGIAACCGATTAIGWYGTQMLVPYALPCLLGVWIFDPVERRAPTWVSSRILRLKGSNAVINLLRFGDLFLHFFPTLTAMILFRGDISRGSALASLPCNLLYLASTRSTKFADTNLIYRVTPEPPAYVWTFIYGSHLAFCGCVFLACCARELVDGVAIA
mmetsp:Transcript_29942/g.85737  ORF Transcript_29942/g.85737 Transcript_29942/m.85737 type:complete len:479 (+) Transcript_29942:39-1475(+)